QGRRRGWGRGSVQLGILTVDTREGSDSRSMNMSEPAMTAGAEEQPPDTQDSFRLLVESVKDYAIFMLDPKGTITSWNPAAERLKGYRASEIIGRHFSAFYTAEDQASGKPDRA